jgi:hypothetical protein
VAAAASVGGVAAASLLTVGTPCGESGSIMGDTAEELVVPADFERIDSATVDAVLLPGPWQPDIDESIAPWLKFLSKGLSDAFCPASFTSLAAGEASGEAPSLWRSSTAGTCERSGQLRATPALASRSAAPLAIASPARSCSRHELDSESRRCAAEPLRFMLACCRLMLIGDDLLRRLGLGLRPPGCALESAGLLRSPPLRACVGPCGALLLALPKE